MLFLEFKMERHFIALIPMHSEILSARVVKVYDNNQQTIVW